MPTTSRGYPYPNSSSSFLPPTDFQNLAAAINTDVGNIVTALGTWTSFTPLLYTNTNTTRSSIAKTVVYAKYIKIGKTVWATADVTCGAVTTNGVSLALPFVASIRQVVIGSAGLMGSGTLPAQSGLAFMTGALDSVAIAAFTNGNGDVGAIGQSFRYSVLYEAAS